MKDIDENEYKVECSLNENTGLINMDVVSYKNDERLDESMKRIDELINYKTPATYAPTNMKMRVEESKNFGDILNLSRELNK